jgi:hypothetical protein
MDRVTVGYWVMLAIYLIVRQCNFDGGGLTMSTPPPLGIIDRMAAPSCGRTTSAPLGTISRTGPLFVPGPNWPLAPPPGVNDMPLLPCDCRGTWVPLDCTVETPLLPVGALPAPPDLVAGTRLPWGSLRPPLLDTAGSMQSPVSRPMAELQLTARSEPLLPADEVAAPPVATFLTVPLLAGLVASDTPLLPRLLIIFGTDLSTDGGLTRSMILAGRQCSGRSETSLVPMMLARMAGNFRRDAPASTMPNGRAARTSGTATTSRGGHRSTEEARST